MEIPRMRLHWRRVDWVNTRNKSFIVVLMSMISYSSNRICGRPLHHLWQVLAVLFVLLSVQARLASAQPALRFEFTETHMGSPVHIVLYTTDAQTAKNSAVKAFARVAELDQIFSDYNPESELMKLVDRFAEKDQDPVAVSPDLFDIFKKSRTISEATGGAFDITAAPVVRQWRRARRDRKLPSSKNIQEAMSRVGYRRVKLIEPDRRVQLEPGTKLDLGGIAKGYAALEALKTLQQRNIPSALVSVAGDIAVGSAPPDQLGWRVAVAGLNPSKDEPLYYLQLTNASISTSGDAERFVEIEGRRYSHIVDTKTGLGIERRATVTVVATDGSAADAYATALYALGVDGSDLLGRLKNPPRLAVSWFEQTADGKVEKRTNARFDKLLKK
jgi:thiamine biosynthesis lipoprotein